MTVGSDIVGSDIFVRFEKLLKAGMTITNDFKTRYPDGSVFKKLKSFNKFWERRNRSLAKEIESDTNRILREFGCCANFNRDKGGPGVRDSEESNCISIN
jgi:hypothetical protein